MPGSGIERSRPTPGVDHRLQSLLFWNGAVEGAVVEKPEKIRTRQILNRSHRLQGQHVIFRIGCGRPPQQAPRIAAIDQGVSRRSSGLKAVSSGTTR